MCVLEHLYLTPAGIHSTSSQYYQNRKINRERNIWIYKHELFHRERPEDLFMVRRRTCPGLDGRKQRFSARKGSSSNNSNNKSNDNSDGEDSISQEETMDHHISQTTFGEISSSSRKRIPLSNVVSLDSLETDDTESAMQQQPKSKKSRKEEQPVSPVVDTSIIRSVVEGTAVDTSLDDTASDDSSLDRKRSSQREMMQQSLVVSDVASKLEEYAKRAWKDRGISLKPRRTGVVTPPFGSTISATELLTYDDEYTSDHDEQLRATDLFGTPKTSSSVVTDSDTEDTADDDRGLDFESPPPKELMVAPVGLQQAKSITERLLLSDVSAAAVAGFCMSTAPYGSPDMSQKILQLIASCETLAADFHQYRNALLPVTLSAEGSSGVVTPIHSVRMSHIQSWEREGSRNAAVSDFKVFSVNCVRKILGKKGFPEGINAFSDDDRAALERTANVWLRSVGTTDNSPRRVSL